MADYQISRMAVCTKSVYTSFEAEYALLNISYYVKTIKSEQIRLFWLFF